MTNTDNGCKPNSILVLYKVERCRKVGKSHSEYHKETHGPGQGTASTTNYDNITCH